MEGLIYYIINILSETFTLLFLPLKCPNVSHYELLKIEFANINIKTKLQYLTL